MEYQEGTIRKCRHCGVFIQYTEQFSNPEWYGNDPDGEVGEYGGYAYCQPYHGQDHEPIEVAQILARYE